MDGDGKNSKRLTSTKATDFYPTLSPDGQTIAFSTRRTGNFEIYLMGIDGSNPRRLTQGLGSCFAPNYSPDGKKIVFVVADEKNVQHIYVMGADGGSPLKISDVGSNVDPTFSPDGKSIAFGSDRDGTPALYVMDANGKNVRRITQNMVVGGRNDWSPDGKRIAFYAGVPYRRDIFVINAGWFGLGDN